jgi:glycosyltransferase involved in cell wall biosynthesis
VQKYAYEKHPFRQLERLKGRLIELSRNRYRSTKGKGHAMHEGDPSVTAKPRGQQVLNRQLLSKSSGRGAPRVAVLSFPWASRGPYKFLSDIALILDPICDKVLIITGNIDRIIRPSKKITLIDIGISMHPLQSIKPTFYSAILWIAKSVLVQIKLSLELIKARNDVDVALFYAAFPYDLLPIVTARALKKRAVEVITVDKAVTPVRKVFREQYKLIFRLLDGISPLSEAILRFYRLDEYPNKLLPEGFRFIDTSRYKVTKQRADRKNVVGFIARLREEKGVVEFVKAIPIIFQQNEDIEFLIGGSGDLKSWVVEECAKLKETLSVKVTITGWIGDDLPDYLNQLKLFVLPTRTEALGTALLEAMACGTPVLATATGGVVDIVEDGKTGFLLSKIEPASIAESVTDILARSDEEMAKVVENGIALVNGRYSYTAAVERYKVIVRGR